MVGACRHSNAWDIADRGGAYIGENAGLPPELQKVLALGTGVAGGALASFGELMPTNEALRYLQYQDEVIEQTAIPYGMNVEEYYQYLKGLDKVNSAILGGTKKVGKGAGGVDDIPQIRKNAAQGKAYEQQEFSKFANNANDAVEQITIKIPEGIKIRVDAIGIDKNSGNVVINEFKSSQTAPLTPNQKVGFPQLEAGGGTVVGNGKGRFTGGFEMPAGTKVEIIRPPK